MLAGNVNVNINKPGASLDAPWVSASLIRDSSVPCCLFHVGCLCLCLAHGVQGRVCGGFVFLCLFLYLALFLFLFLFLIFAVCLFLFSISSCGTLPRWALDYLLFRGSSAPASSDFLLTVPSASPVTSQH